MAEHFNDNLSYIRRSKGISQVDLEKGTGIDRSIISRIENGKIETSMDYAYKISEYLDVPLQDMVTKDLRFEETEFVRITRNEFKQELESLLSRTDIDDEKKEYIKKTIEMMCKDE